MPCSAQSGEMALQPEPGQRLADSECGPLAWPHATQLPLSWLRFLDSLYEIVRRPPEGHQAQLPPVVNFSAWKATLPAGFSECSKC